MAAGNGALKQATVYKGFYPSALYFSPLLQF